MVKCGTALGREGMSSDFMRGNKKDFGMTSSIAVHMIYLKNLSAVLRLGGFP